MLSAMGGGREVQPEVWYYHHQGEQPLSGYAMHGILLCDALLVFNRNWSWNGITPTIIYSYRNEFSNTVLHRYEQQHTSDRLHLAAQTAGDEISLPKAYLKVRLEVFK